ESVYKEPYTTLADEKGAVEVHIVDGCVVRSFYKTDYTEGGHGYVYRWVPKSEIWIEAALDHSELPFIVAHEYTERRLMRDEGLDYDTAHEICSKMEFQLRKNEGARPLLHPATGKMTKVHLPGLTTPEFFAYVVKTYVRK